MTVDLSVAGVEFEFPQVGDENWGEAVTAWAAAISAAAFYKSGGLYTLTSEVDFGAIAGVKSLYFKTRTANPATAGQLRLARADVLSWRNQANSANLDLAVNSSDQLTYMGVPLSTSQITVSDTSTIDLTLAGVDLSAIIVAGSVSNSHIANSAAIAYSKLALTGSIVNADVSASAAVAYSKLALTNSIVNADVATGAAIAYSKLNLSGAILNADINASAAIAYSKLNLSGAILNADINASAAIAYSKLALTGSILNADINTSAAIAYSKLNLATSIVNADVSASAAIAYSKLNLSGAILNADINASAAIAYSKLNLSGAILNADINASAAIARSKFASGSANRLVSNNGSGVMTDLAAITASRILVSDSSGLPVANAAVTASRAMVSDSSGFPAASSVTSTTLAFLDAASSVQTQFDALSRGADGRLTLTSATPVLTGDVSGATTIYYTPYIGDRVALYDGTTWRNSTFTELSQATTDTTKSPAAVANNSNYDMFVWSDSGTLRCTRGPAWSSDTSRGTGAGTTELERVGGRLVNKVAITNGPAAQRGLYVGTVRSNGSAAIDMIFGGVGANGTAARLCVWNQYNRVRTVTAHIGDSTDTWAYATATWRSANNSTTMRASFVLGEASVVDAEYQCYVDCTAAVNAGGVGVGLDITNGYTGTSGNAQARVTVSGGFKKQVAAGFHFAQAVEYAVNAVSVTFFGDGGNATIFQNSLTVAFDG